MPLDLMSAFFSDRCHIRWSRPLDKSDKVRPFFILFCFVRTQKGRVSRRVIVLSNLEGELDCEQMNEVIRNLQKASVSVDFVGLHVLPNGSLKPEECAPELSAKGTHSSQMHERITALTEILAAVGGKSFTFQ